MTSARQAITIEWWETYRDLDVFISELVLEEIGTGDLQAASNRLNFRSPILCSPEELINER